ncbi:hypothetical protein GA0115246_114403 [Streptomyces sp. SolWspMP-sol7th]|nr:hypothetical protein GA0115246_114403 [Streptomyces sp. SolWspMP-sol7th]
MVEEANAEPAGAPHGAERDGHGDGAREGAGHAEDEAGHEAREHGGDREGEALDGPLPEGVRHRVVRYVATGFGGLTVGELPAQLRQYARFTPSRRLKYAGNAMAAAVENDAAFRARVAERLCAAQPELCAALNDGHPAARRRPRGRRRRRVPAASPGLAQARSRGR